MPHDIADNTYASKPYRNTSTPEAAPEPLHLDRLTYRAENLREDLGNCVVRFEKSLHTLCGEKSERPERTTPAEGSKLGGKLGVLEDHLITIGILMIELRRLAQGMEQLG